MTVESSIRKTTFAGGTSILTFSFKALVGHESDIKVKKTLISTGAETDLVYATGYTVALAADGVGGVVTVSPTFSTLYTLTVYRETTNKQESDYDDYNQFPADTLETDLDRRTLVAQEKAEENDRTLKMPITYSPTIGTLPIPVANKILGWNAGATAIENKIALDEDDVAAAAASAAAAEVARAAAVVAQEAAEAVSGWDIASQAEAEAGTDNLTVMTPLRAAQAIAALVGADPLLDADTRFEVGSFTRDVSLTTAQSITTLAFQPKAVIFLAAIDGINSASWGIDDATNHMCINQRTTNVFLYNATMSITPTDNAVDTSSQGYVASMDATGFTLTWGKTGSPTGTARIIYLAFK